MKVLSIDIDYAFPAVENWPNDDNELWDEWHPSTKWTEYFSKYPELEKRESSIDEGCLDYMLDTFTKALTANPNITVAFGLDHDYILDSVLEHDDIEIVNIDHHDDFLAGCYIDMIEPDDDEDEHSNQTFLALHLLEYHYTKAFGKVDEGSWGAYLHSLGKLKAFTWIRNEGKKECDTRSPVNRFICENIGKRAEWDTCLADEYDHGDYMYDHIFVCLSPQYFPMSQWGLFSIFMGIYEDFTGKDCKLEEFWDKRWINKMAYKDTRNILKESLANVKKSLDK